jgi:hypothetical protein
MSEMQTFYDNTNTTTQGPKKNLYIDTSGSVSGFPEYWGQVGAYFAANQASINKIYFWDSTIKEVSPQTLIQYINVKKGHGGTDPKLIAKTIIQEKNYSNVVIFTDGEVSDGDVANTDELLKDIELNDVTCFIICSNGTQPRLSVTCPFTRSNASEIYYKQASEPTFRVQKNSARDLELIRNLEKINLDTFNQKYAEIESLLIAKNMGRTGDSATKEQLLILKKNLVHELAIITKANFGSDIRQALVSNDFDLALKYANGMTLEYFGSDIGMEIEKKIGHLITLCGDLRGKYSLDAIKSNRFARADNAKVATCTIVDIELSDLTSKPVECPIIMDQDVAQLLILFGEPVLANVDKKIVDDIINCPLRILNYPELVEKLAKLISHWTGIKINEHLTSNPFTRQQLLGTIPLGNCRQHVDCGNYTIARLFTGGKILGNIHLYWAVIWYLINSGRFQYLNDIKDQATEHLKYRLTHYNTNASLCGNPQFVISKVPVDIAIWYCINSCLLNQPTDRDTIRYHMFNLDPMIEITRVFGYPISDQTINQINRVKVMMSMLSLVKKDEVRTNNRIRCLYQNAIRIDTSKLPENVVQLEKIIEWIPLDGPASHEQVEAILDTFPKYYRNLTIAELVGISQMVSPSLSASDIQLETTWVPPNLKYLVNWSYGLNPILTYPVTICPSTFRPYYMVKDEEKTICWTEMAIKLHGPIEKQCSSYRKFIDYFVKYNEFPNFEMFAIFCYNRYLNKFGSNTCTLPFQFKLFFDDIIQSYNPIFKLIIDHQINPTQIYNIFMSGSSIVRRLEMEQEQLTQLL